MEAACLRKKWSERCRQILGDRNSRATVPRCCEGLQHKYFTNRCISVRPNNKGHADLYTCSFFLFSDMLFMTQITSSALSVHTNLHTCCYQHVRSKERKCKRFLNVNEGGRGGV